LRCQGISARRLLTPLAPNQSPSAAPFWSFRREGGAGGLFEGIKLDGTVPVPKTVRSLIERLWWRNLSSPATVASLLSLVYASPVDDARLLQRILEATEHPGGSRLSRLGLTVDGSLYITGPRHSTDSIYPPTQAPSTHSPPSSYPPKPSAPLMRASRACSAPCCSATAKTTRGWCPSGGRCGCARALGSAG